MTTQTEALKLALEALQNSSSDWAHQVKAHQQAIAAIEAVLAQPDNTSKMYEELRSIIDGGSESFTHEDAVKYLKDVLAQPEQGPVALCIDGKNINNLQAQSIQRVIARSKGAHMTDIKLRINGQDEWYEADWIKYLKQTTEFKCDGDFPEGFDSSCGLPAQALRTANAIMCDTIGKREWDVPCAAQHLLSFAKLYTTPPQRTWVELTDEDKASFWTADQMTHEEWQQLFAEVETKLKEKNT